MRVIAHLLADVSVVTGAQSATVVLTVTLDDALVAVIALTQTMDVAVSTTSACVSWKRDNI